MRPLLTVLLAFIALGGTAASAHAAVSVSVGERSLATEDVDSEDSTPLTMLQGDAAADRVVVVPDAEGLTVSPAAPGTTVTGTDGCATVRDGARCEGASTALVVADLGAGDDELTIQAAPDAAGPPVELHGGPGNDVLRGGPGSDGLDGGPGVDVLDGGSGGQDVADYTGETAPVQVDADAGAAQTADGPEQLVGIEGAFGGAGDDVLRAAPAGGRLVGGPGADRLVGGPGDDTIIAVDPDRTGAADGGPGDGADVVAAGAGDDDVTASSTDRVDAGAGDDVLDVSPEDGRLAPSTSLACGPGVDRVPLHAAQLVLGPDCERFAEARQHLTTAGDFAGTLRFTRTSASSLRVSSAQRCKRLQVRLRGGRGGRVTAVRTLRSTAPTRLPVPAGTSAVEALGCGSRSWTLQARVRR